MGGITTLKSTLSSSLLRAVLLLIYLSALQSVLAQMTRDYVRRKEDAKFEEAFALALQRYRCGSMSETLSQLHVLAMAAYNCLCDLAGKKMDVPTEVYEWLKHASANPHERIKILCKRQPESDLECDHAISPRV